MLSRGNPIRPRRELFMFADNVYEVLEAFDNAVTEQDYKNAKRLCCERFPYAEDQLSFVDAARDAFKRTKGVRQ